MATSIIKKQSSGNNSIIFSRPNLLDNWYFADERDFSHTNHFPIIQNGITDREYICDRWIYYNSAREAVDIDLISTGLQMTVSSSRYSGQIISQYLLSTTRDSKSLWGATITFSVLVSSVSGTGFGIQIINDNDLYAVADSVMITGPGVYKITKTIPTSGEYNNIFVDIVAIKANNGDTCVIEAAKLEVGDTQTLAHQENGAWVLNDIPNYSEELSKCQAYYYNTNNTYSDNADIVSCFAVSTTMAYAIVQFPVTMVDALFFDCNVNQWCLTSGYELHDITQIIMDRYGSNRARLNIRSSDLTAGKPYCLHPLNLGSLVFYAY